jgi:hypothetical protein
MFDVEQLEKAMTYLATTDTEYAHEKAELEKAEIARKRIRARFFLTHTGSVEERKARAEVEVEVCTADDQYLFCIKVFETLRARRQRAEIVIDVWRSMEASRRKS